MAREEEASVAACAATAADEEAAEAATPLLEWTLETGSWLAEPPAAAAAAGKAALRRWCRWRWIGRAAGDAREALLGTRMSILYLALPAAIAAHQCQFGGAWIFSLSLAGLVPLAERISFLSEQIACYAGPTVGGLLNATFGNVPELIISLMALWEGKLELLKWSLLGSVLSNLLLVLGSSLFIGSLANMNKERPFNKTQAGVNMSLLLLGVACHSFILLYGFAASSSSGRISTTMSSVQLSRFLSIIMLVAYIACLFFQLDTHRQHYQPLEDSLDQLASSEEEEEVVLGFGSSVIWLAGMTAMVTLLSEYVVETVEEASRSWGVSTSFICIILLPLAGNAAEHAGAIIYAVKNKIDLSLSVTLGSSAQISMFVVPLSSMVAWAMGVPMDIDFKLLETGSLAIAVITTFFIIQDGTWHYAKGLVLLLTYAAIGVLFFHLKTQM